jgi:superfamily II DNA or RNA helicase
MNLFGDSLKKKLQVSEVEVKRPVEFHKGDLFFQITEEKGGLVLKVVNKNGQTVTDYLAEDYPANLRNVLHFYRYYKVKDADIVYLADNPSIIRLITLCDNLVNAKMEKINVIEVTFDIYLHITRQNLDYYVATFSAATMNGYVENFKMLSEEYVMSNNMIIPITPIGARYSLLHEFIQSIPINKIEQYLSVFYSYFENVKLSVEMRHYQIVYRNEQAKRIRPAILINGFLDDMSLSVKVIPSVPEFDSDLTEDIRLFYIATLDRRGILTLSKVVYKKTEKDILKIHKTLYPYCKSKDEWENLRVTIDSFLLPKHLASKFLEKCLPALSLKYRVLGTKNLGKTDIKPLHPRIRMLVSYGVDYFCGVPKVQIGDVECDLAEFLRKFENNEFIELSNLEKGIINGKLLKRLKRLCDNVDKKTGEYKMSFFDIPEIERLLNCRLEGKDVKPVRTFYEGMAELGNQPPLSPKVNAKLRAYQEEGLKWLYYLYQNDRNGCMADDMGLGKTLQAIALLSLVHKNQQQPAIIIMPNSLLFNWENELKRFAPHLSYSVYYGKTRDLNESFKANIILTTYNIVRLDIRQLKERSYHYIILDESQAIKNYDAKTTKAVCLLKSSHRLALSGTPIENNITELYSLFSFLEPTMFGPFNKFKDKYLCNIMEGNRAVTEELRARVFPFILRRMKEDVLDDLPDLSENVIYVEMNEKQKKLYEVKRKIALGLIGNSKMQVTFFEALSELRRIASIPEIVSHGQIPSPKADLLTERICQTLEGEKKKVVVFFHFLGGIETIGKRLDEYHIGYETITGATRNRKKVIEKFNTDENCKVLLMTLKTGGVGLNLTVADTVFIYEPWWNKAAEIQGIDRLHRIGQKQKVFSYSIISKGSIEERILELQELKTDLCNEIIKADKDGGKILTDEDMRYLLK